MSKRYWIGLLAATAVVAGGMPVSDAGEKLRERLRERMAERMGAEQGPKAPGSETISYGSDPLQVLDIWRARGTKGPAPLIVYVHGGGWQRGSKDNATGRFKPVHYPSQGYAFASINYRLVPAATVEEQAADVAAAVRAIVDRADAL
ncbi:MAG: alpha/beta hydrolase fold domain-containing protein, partial [Sphingopyxis sp.]|nr:alpha/beta hydrolase fold domain-containing protein [Sphingopyxis sp.]